MFVSVCKQTNRQKHSTAGTAGFSRPCKYKVPEDNRNALTQTKLCSRTKNSKGIHKWTSNPHQQPGLIFQQDQ